MSARPYLRVAGYMHETGAAAVGVVGLDYDAAGEEWALATQREVLAGMLRLARGGYPDQEDTDKESRIGSSGLLGTLPVIVTCAGGPGAEADLMRILAEHAAAAEVRRCKLIPVETRVFSAWCQRSELA
jgi:hypothetical protein